jgi:hypothetical protein
MRSILKYCRSYADKLLVGDDLEGAIVLPERVRVAQNTILRHDLTDGRRGKFGIPEFPGTFRGGDPKYS